MTQQVKTMFKDYIPAIILAGGIIMSYATLTTRHEEAMRRITAIENTLREDHDKVTGMLKDVEHIRKTVDKISTDMHDGR
jgi:peptidoglycan hydrolase CwlO-like protein